MIKRESLLKKLIDYKDKDIIKIITGIRRYKTTILIADKYYPSTKKCMRCGQIKEMKINDRIYNCDYCGLVIDRDYNSAINLANYIK